MIKIYKESNYFSNDEVLIDNESFFNNNISATELNTLCEDIMYSIDDTVLLDKNLGTVKTPFGITGISSLSLGCKTAINYALITTSNKYKNIKAINATECGWNALEKIFSIAEQLDSDIAIIIEHDNDLFKCSNREYIINGEKTITSLFDF